VSEGNHKGLCCIIHAQERDLIDLQTQEQVVYPMFVSTRYGDPAYAQLSIYCASQIRRGATGGSEMGVFHELHQAQRQDNIMQLLKEYLPLNLDAEVLFVS
jgi:hypothetical protein